MLDILLEVLAEIFGLKEPPPQSRRRQPPAQGRNAGGAAGDAAPKQTAALEDLVRKITGLDEAPPPR
ncbi:MAG: hypothetical protein LBS30_05860, partial [Planctomycetota bacterium]|nr:hypothetical protein [Planctomycetota bacterium]